MIVKLMTEHHLEFLSLKGGCRGSSESTHVKMPHCWKSHATARIIHVLAWSFKLVQQVEEDEEFVLKLKMILVLKKATSLWGQANGWRHSVPQTLFLVFKKHGDN